jgi:beta-N-acetylhexosaminidase
MPTPMEKRRRTTNGRNIPKRPSRSRIQTLEPEAIEAFDTVQTPSVTETSSVETADSTPTPNITETSAVDAVDTFKLPVQEASSQTSNIETIDTQKMASPFPDQGPTSPPPRPQRAGMAREKIVLLIALLCVLVLHATQTGLAQFIGVQGWAYVLGDPATANNPNLLKDIEKQVYSTTPTPGVTAQPTVQITPQRYVDLIVQKMTLDQKLGQMMIVQFVGPSYSLDLSTMISQYGAGAVLIFTANNNIVNKAQLKDLIQQMQHNSTLPMAVAIDQEGGVVDRLVNLDGPRPSEATIGATNDPGKARAEGIQDAQDLANYGFNLNLAPVVDVTNVYNPQLYTRTYGNNADLVTKMAAAYLQGLQKSGKVLGTLKHFPGLGDVGVDPHSGVPDLTRSRSDLERIDWAPYRTLIQQGNLHAIMVTHEMVPAIDTTLPSSLSPKLVRGILRQEYGFDGVIMTDSLTMEGITAYYTEAQAAALAVEAGDDLLMGAATPSDVAAMIKGIKDAINAGSISQQRIDDSVRRILMMKYAMGLLPIPTN